MPPRLARIVKTFTFRLALVYVGLFSLSVILLFAFIYTFEMHHLKAQVTAAIHQQYNYLIDEYKKKGTAGVEARISELITDDDQGSEVYLLVNQKYQKLAGNINAWPIEAAIDGPFEKKGHWVHFRMEVHNWGSSSPDVGVKAIMIPLSKWRYLLAGRTLESAERVQQTIIQTFWASLMLTLAMAFAGAVIMTRSVIRRINVINRSADTIMHGNLSARIPFTKGGDEFDELSSNLNKMLDKIEMLLGSLSQFANNIAHDLRSPLNRIISRLDAGMRTIGQDNPAQKILEKNIREMQELVDTFNSILNISELEANTEFRAFEDCDLKAIIGNLVEFYEPYAAEKNIALVFSSPLEGEGQGGGGSSKEATSFRDPLPLTPSLKGRGDFIVYGEKNLLTQAFANLIDNALKFTPEGGYVSIASEGRSVSIADSGPGIPSEYRGKVFEKFFRLEQSRNTKGNGLGLSLVAAIARIHNATIALEDNHPGLRVTLSFP